MKTDKRKLKAIFSMPSWQRHAHGWYGYVYHAGRKHSRELSNEEKARKGQPIK